MYKALLEITPSSESKMPTFEWFWFAPKMKFLKILFSVIDLDNLSTCKLAFF